MQVTLGGTENLEDLIPIRPINDVEEFENFCLRGVAKENLRKLVS